MKASDPEYTPHWRTRVYRKATNEDMCRCGHPIQTHGGASGHCYFRLGAYSHCVCRCFETDDLEDIVFKMRSTKRKERNKK
jgi:hypothetical protein